ncbi:hypothetical protein PABG_11113 [Paracoccidioides brasiliensis Pb03]|nr:hypothetical protein PABG_11113 [Paracoccidioides brasiliensis Pb03]
MLPWDWDIDTQVNNSTLRRMADHFNHTICHYKPEDNQPNRDYLLDVNPYSRQRERGQGQNIIDARWIDTRNGLYIDITGISEINPETEPGILQCKNFHKYKISDIYPMRDSMYEGVPARIPYKYYEILVKEYGPSALVIKDHEDHYWDPILELWIPDEKRIAATAKLTPEERKMKQDDDKRIREDEIRQLSKQMGLI